MTFFQDVSLKALASLLEPHMGQPAWPGLHDPVARDRARAHLKQTGRWENLPAEAHPHLPFPQIRRSLYRDYQRTGNRTTFEEEYRRFQRELNSTLLSLWLDHPEADLDRAQDLVWAICEMTTWVLPAHEPLHLDLSSTALGKTLAECSHLFADRFEAEIPARIRTELQRRILAPACDPARADNWQTVDTNWNHVCNANLIGTALYQIEDAHHLAAFIHPIVMRLGYAIDGFTDDGGCVEGPGYWDYGFKHFVEAALMLRQRTGGKINLMSADPKIERICRFPLATQLSGPLQATFSDSGHGWITPAVALRINQFFPIPELFALADRTVTGDFLHLSDIRDFTLYRDERPETLPGRDDYFLPHLGFARIHAAEPSSRVVLAVTAGSNDVSHNHNDLGSFITCHHGEILLTDPGAPIYTSKTFGPDRYEILVCRSRGHSVPLINGHEQSAGPDFSALLTREKNSRPGDGKTVCANLAWAYADPTLKSLARRWTVFPDGKIRLVDAFVFTETPKALEEAFMTYVEVELLSGEYSVRLKGKKSSPILQAASAGYFSVETFSPEAHEGRSTDPLYRLKFTPGTLAKEMTLVFTLA